MRKLLLRYRGAASPRSGGGAGHQGGTSLTAARASDLTDGLRSDEILLTSCIVCGDAIECEGLAVRLERDAETVRWSLPRFPGGTEDAIPPSHGIDDADDGERDRLERTSAIELFPAMLQFRADECDAALDRVELLIQAYPWPLRKVPISALTPEILRRARRRR